MLSRINSASKHHPLHSRRRKIHLPLGVQRFLAVFEGLEGGFAIGASIIVALSFTNLSRSVLLVAAIISIVVNGFNNASVKYSSEHFLDELDGREKRNPLREYFIPALIEFLSYLVISFVSILPLVIVSDLHLAVVLSVLVTIVVLYAAGYWRAYMLQMPPRRDAVETALLGAGIVFVGLVSGYVIHVLEIGI